MPDTINKAHHFRKGFIIMKRKTLALILSGAGAVLLAFLWHAACGISLFAKVDTQPAGNSHTNAEMQQAVSLVRKDFRRFNGCVMTRLTYDEAQTQEELNGYYAQDPDIDDLIILDSDFTVSKSLSQPEFGGASQHGWKWIVVHTEAEGWKLLGSGLA